MEKESKKCKREYFDIFIIQKKLKNDPKSNDYTMYHMFLS